MSIKPETESTVFSEYIYRLRVLKRETTVLYNNLTDEEKADELISAKLPALDQKISQLEKLINQASETFDKEINETQALLDSFDK